MSASDTLIGTLGLAALVTPGWLIARAARVPVPWVAGFIGSAVTLVALILVCDATGLRLRFTTLGPWWTFVTLAAVWFHRRTSSRPAPTAPPLSPGAMREHAPLWLPLLPVLAVVIYRATAQPLFGVDTIFRWNYLAEQMLARATLGFYPPVSAADFEIYAWPDGIAPLVSSLYFWLYALAGAARPALTAPLVVFQFAALVFATHALARRMFSDRAAAFAVALLAASPVFAWATVMGQETGLTALSFVALLLYLPRDRTEESRGLLVAAALAAGLGALAREYGLVVPVLGLALCATRRLSLRGTLWFAAVAALAALPWYARNWVATGNPLHPLSVGSLFPTNPVHAWLNESFRVEFGWAQLPPEAARLFLTNSLAGLLGALAGGMLFFRSARTLLFTIALVVALWVASVAYTAAGFIATLRVLNPAFALAAVLGGAALAHWIPGQRGRAVAILGLTLFAGDAALRALTLPANVYRVPPNLWLTLGGAIHEFHARPAYRELAQLAGAERLLVLGPNALLTRQGARTVPLWSPEVRWLFDAGLPAAEIGRRLRSQNIGYVLLNAGPANERFLARSAFFRDPAGALQLLWSDADLVLLRVTPEKK